MTTNTPTVTARLSDQAIHPLRTLDPAEPLDDLAWLDEAIGDARVVAIGESAHYNSEYYRLRHRLLRYLVQRHGFGAYAMESGFTEGWTTDSWVRGTAPAADLDQVMAGGVTSLMGLWTEMRTHLAWMRDHNSTGSPQVGFYGIDLPGSNASLLPGLDAVLGYLAQADPGFEVDPEIREAAAIFAASSPFSVPAAMSAYANLTPEQRNSQTANLADLTARLTARRLDYVARTGVESYERTLRTMRLTATLDMMIRQLPQGNQRDVMLNRDAAMADTVEWILQRADRVLLAAHNGHIQRHPTTLPGMPPTATLGMHLADRLGGDYVVIGTTAGTGRTLNTDPSEFYAGKLFQDLPAPEPGSLDALMVATSDGPFAADLRHLSPADSAAVEACTRHRIGAYYADLDALNAFDVVVHIPHVTAAEPDRAALTHTPQDVQETFAAYRATSSAD
ncbi:erythromycin esterase family protein [Nocardia sp. NPDC052566]|uniref:erythromycin esterase family protein n=1 Tax=Nocardia sp. NPDC052566 TaxID=3364330 RepID=UPI0037CBD601